MSRGKKREDREVSKPVGVAPPLAGFKGWGVEHKRENRAGDQIPLGSKMDREDWLEI
jgi:hypothetical protein